MKKLVVFSLLFVTQVALSSEAASAIQPQDQGFDEFLLNEPRCELFTAEDLSNFRKTVTAATGVAVVCSDYRNTGQAVFHGEDFPTLTMIVPVRPNSDNNF